MPFPPRESASDTRVAPRSPFVAGSLPPLSALFHFPTFSPSSSPFVARSLRRSLPILSVFQMISPVFLCPRQAFPKRIRPRSRVCGDPVRATHSPSALVDCGGNATALARTVCDARGRHRSPQEKRRQGRRSPKRAGRARQDGLNNRRPSRDQARTFRRNRRAICSHHRRARLAHPLDHGQRLPWALFHFPIFPLSHFPPPPSSLRRSVASSLPFRLFRFLAFSLSLRCVMP